MGRPQQPELARSAKTDLDPDHVETGLQGQKKPGSGGETGPVPPENQPGHHPREEQDKPDLDAFAAKLGTEPKTSKAGSAPKATKAPKAAHFSAAQPEPEGEAEPRLVGLVLLPLRETVKRLEQLERKLTERLATRDRGSRAR